MEEKDKKIVEEAIIKAKEYLNRIPFIGNPYKDISYWTKCTHPESTWYEYKEGKYYKCFEQRGNIDRRFVASNENEMIDYLIRCKVFSYAKEYEFKHRHYFEDNTRVVDTIEEFCYYLMGKKKTVNRHNYDDEGAIIFDLLDFWRKKCIELKEKYEESNVDLDDINYIIKREYADTPSGGMHNPREGIKKAHEKVGIIQQKFPETVEYFKLYEKWYNKLNLPE